MEGQKQKEEKKKKMINFHISIFHKISIIDK